MAIVLKLGAETMRKIPKFGAPKAFVATMAVGVTLASCKVNVPTTESSDVESMNAAKPADVEKEKIKNDIKSWNVTQKDLLDAKEKGASAKTKLDIAWMQIKKTAQKDDQIVTASGDQAIIFGNGTVVRFWRIFQGWADYVNGNPQGSEIRPYEVDTKNYVRLTHRYSVFSKLSYVPNENAKKYSGQWGSGTDYVLGRFSSAVSPGSAVDRFTPAFSAKFFLGGKNDSQVLITQHDIGGQSQGETLDYVTGKPRTINNDYFLKPLSNRLSFEKGVYSGVGAFSRFYYAAKYFSKLFDLNFVMDPRELQADHLSAKNVDGSDVEGAKGPRFVWTVAGSEGLKTYFAKAAETEADYRKHFLALNKPVAGVANSGTGKGIVISKVYASDTWTYTPEKDATLIGELVTNSNFVSSESADIRMFFKHSIKYRPINEEESRVVYNQDFDYNQWNTEANRDELFTSNCRLGVKEKEVTPLPGVNKIKIDDLDGTFVRDAVLTRKTKDGSYCAPDLLLSRFRKQFDVKKMADDTKKKFEEWAGKLGGF